MTTTTTATEYNLCNLPQVGDQVIVVRSSKYSIVEPEIATVDHTTKSGWFRFEGGKNKYKMYSNRFAELTGTSKYHKEHIEVFPFTLDNLAAARKQYDERLAVKAANEAEANAKMAERKAKWAAETAVVLRLVPEWKRLAMVPPPCPDGSRVYQHTFYNRPYKAIRGDGTVDAGDHGWVWVIITTKDVEERDWMNHGETIKKIELAVTYRTARSSSFSSCSTEKHDTEEAAVYEGLRYAYHSCW